MFYLRVLSFFMIALYLDSTVVIQTVCIFTQNCVAYSYYFVSFLLCDKNAPLKMFVTHSLFHFSAHCFAVLTLIEWVTTCKSSPYLWDKPLCFVHLPTWTVTESGISCYDLLRSFGWLCNKLWIAYSYFVAKCTKPQFKRDLYYYYYWTVNGYHLYCLKISSLVFNGLRNFMSN